MEDEKGDEEEEEEENVEEIEEQKNVEEKSEGEEKKNPSPTSAHRLVESAIIEKWYPMSLKYSASVIPV